MIYIHFLFSLSSLFSRFDTDGFKAIQSEKLIKILMDESINDEIIPMTNREEEEEEEDLHSARSRDSRTSRQNQTLTTPRLPSKNIFFIIE